MLLLTEMVKKRAANSLPTGAPYHSQQVLGNAYGLLAVYSTHQLLS